MLNYLKMKRNEIKIKVMLYGIIVNFIDNQKDVLNFMQKMYLTLKDIPQEELQSQFIEKLGEIIHDENKEMN